MAFVPQFGWAGPQAEKSALEQSFHQLNLFTLYGAAAKADRMDLSELVKKVTGGYLKNPPQPVGDCVSRGTRHAVATLACVEIALLGENEVFKDIYPPYIYSISRMAPECGNGQMGSGDGSTGIWGVTAEKLYGNIEWADRPYEATIIRRYGRSMPPGSETADGKKHVIKAFARIRTADDAWLAISNGYPLQICSNQGYNMQTKQHDGKSWFVGNDTWSHCMAIDAVDTKPGLCFRVQNSWGNGVEVHGQQLDGDNGTGWITAEQFDRHVNRDGECYAVSAFEGFPGNSRLWKWL